MDRSGKLETQFRRHTRQTAAPPKTSESGDPLTFVQDRPRAGGRKKPPHAAEAAKKRQDVPTAHEPRLKKPGEQ